MIKTLSDMPYRKERLEKEIYKEASTIISYEVRDPLINALYVTRVELAENLQLAYIYLYTEDEIDLEKTRMSLIAAGPFVQNRINKHLKTKKKIEVHLYFDKGLKNQIRINKLLEEVKGETDETRSEEE